MDGFTAAREMRVPPGVTQGLAIVSSPEDSMNRDAIEVGAFSWARIQRLYDADAAVYWQRCESDGLQCPQEVFTQLFHRGSQ
jgi:hypothetical protein